jgi:hypothetical protein
LRVLIACEFSGAVRDAFTRRGHYAVSADPIPSETAGAHYVGDVRDLLHLPWDMLIAFPPCTYLTRAGARYWPQWAEEQAAAVSFVRLLAAAAPLTCIENPPGALTRLWRPATQYVCPSWWGAPYTKKTGLWLTGLDPLPRPAAPAAPGPRPAAPGPRPEAFLAAFPHSGAGHAKQGAAWKRRVRTPLGLAEAMSRYWG